MPTSLTSNTSLSTDSPFTITVRTLDELLVIFLVLMNKLVISLGRSAIHYFPCFPVGYFTAGRYSR